LFGAAASEAVALASDAGCVDGAGFMAFACGSGMTWIEEGGSGATVVSGVTASVAVAAIGSTGAAATASAGSAGSGRGEGIGGAAASPVVAASAGPGACSCGKTFARVDILPTGGVPATTSKLLTGLQPQLLSRGAEASL
jgi:hypothetical protein